MKERITEVLIILLFITIAIFPILALINIWDIIESKLILRLFLTDIVLMVCFGIASKENYEPYP
jgi:hypothetical protein